MYQGMVDQHILKQGEDYRKLRDTGFDIDQEIGI